VRDPRGNAWREAGSWSLLGIRLSSAGADAIATACTEPGPVAGPPAIVACANLHSMATATRDPEFAAALRAATFVTADGAPVRAAGRMLGEPVGPRVTGYDVFEQVMARLDKRDGRALFVGSLPPVLDRIVANAARDYRHVSVDTLSPPFGDLSGGPTDQILARVAVFRPDVVFVGLSAPKQEIWATQNAGAIRAGAVICIGAVFDYYAGTLRRAPPLIRRIGAEWLYRLAQEPRRVWRKYFVSGPIFACGVLAEWFARRAPRPQG
jgi:N-acetylglucosaminyldiphosphoundecaprenol N-acetyl-beta-D-mannosaminyltransferase